MSSWILLSSMMKSDLHPLLSICKHTGVLFTYEWIQDAGNTFGFPSRAVGPHLQFVVYGFKLQIKNVFLGILIQFYNPTPYKVNPVGSQKISNHEELQQLDFDISVWSLAKSGWGTVCVHVKVLWNSQHYCIGHMTKTNKRNAQKREK